MVRALLPYIIPELRRQLRAGYAPIVVVSAVKGVTDAIILFVSALKHGGAGIDNFIGRIREMHNKLFQDIGVSAETEQHLGLRLDVVLPAMARDLHAFAHNSTSLSLEAKITAYGEKLSAVCMAEYLASHGLAAKEVFAEDIPIITDDNFLDADIAYAESEKHIQQYMPQTDGIPVISGFTGRTPQGDVTILGRGGTDTTACFVGAALRAKKVVLWKDVGGVYSADPRLVPKAKTIFSLSYDEVEEAGKIIQGKAIRYLRQYNISSEVASLVHPKDKTSIQGSLRAKHGARLVSFKPSLTLLSIHQGESRGYERLFDMSKLFADYKVNIVLIWNDPGYLHVAVEDNSGALQQLTQEIERRVPNLAIAQVHMVTIVGNFGWKDVNIFNRVLHTLDAKALMGAYPYPKCMRMEGIVTSDNDVAHILRVMHKTFIHT